jgi:hypothetical protein
MTQPNDRRQVGGRRDTDSLIQYRVDLGWSERIVDEGYLAEMYSRDGFTVTSVPVTGTDD